ncbi:MAG: CHAD domain-containing protein [Gammaproteobacteria bacterium]|nr:CHAD domain-containing protein [Gammaproteobacteria bacterium]
MSEAEPGSRTLEVRDFDPQLFTRITRALADAFPVSVEAVAERRVFFDTFDWSVHGRGLSLVDVKGGDRTLQLGPAGCAPVAVWEGAGRVMLAADLPVGYFQDTLAGVIGIRALLPRIVVDSRGERCAIANEEGKTVVEVCSLTHTVGRPNWASTRAATKGRRARGPAILRIVPVAGHAKALKRVVRIISDICERPSASLPEPACYAEAIGLVPGGYSSKLALSLDADLCTVDAVQAILENLLETFEANEEGTLLDLDIEFLHDFRVASRRCRSLISALKKWLPPVPFARLNRELKWLGELTGPVRDADVFALELADLGLTSVSGAPQVALEQYLMAEHDKARAKLARALRTERYQRVKELWRRLVDDSSLYAKCPAADSRVIDVATARISKVFQRVIRQCASLDETTPAELVHELRIDAKKLRYLLEFFRSLYPSDDVEAFIANLKKLQDELGDFNDLDVQQDTLQGHAGAMFDKGIGTPELFLELGRATERLAQRQVGVRKRVNGACKAFATKSSRKAFRRVLAQAGTTK